MKPSRHESSNIWYVYCDRHHHNCRHCYQPHYRVQVNNAIGLTIVAVNYVIYRSSIRCHPCIYHSWEHYGMLGIVSSTVLFKAEINTTWYISLDICTHMYSKTTPNRCALKLARSKSHCEISHKHFSNVPNPLQDKLMINDSWRCNLLLNG